MPSLGRLEKTWVGITVTPANGDVGQQEGHGQGCRSRGGKGQMKRQEQRLGASEDRRQTGRAVEGLGS